MVSLSETQLMNWLTPILWPFLRVLAVFSSAPVFSSKAFPVRARIGLALLVAVAAQPSLQAQPVLSLLDSRAAAAVIHQVAVGLAIGFATRLVFAAFELAGEVVGFQMGLNYASFFDPSLNTQSSAAASFFGQVTLFMFVVMNGHLTVLMAVIQSFDAFPLDQVDPGALRGLNLVGLGGHLFASAFWIALPMIAVLMFVNLGLGIVSRVAPQMNIYAVGFPITLTVGLVAMAFTLPLLDQPMMELMDRTITLFLKR